MGEMHVSQESEDTGDTNLNLCLEGNYVLSLIDKFKWIDKNSWLQVSILLFLVGWAIPCVIAYGERVLLPWETAINSYGMPSITVNNKCYLFDLTMYAFYIFSLPILFSREYHVFRTLNDVVRFAFRTRVLSIPPQDLQKSIDKTNRYAQSPILHLLLLILAYVLSILWMHTLRIDEIDSWHGAIGTLSWSGLYVALVSIPLALYVIYMWAFKALVWIKLLKDMTKDPDRVNVYPLHPDRCGGLSFLNAANFAWGRLILSVGALVFLDYLNFVYLHEAKFYRWDLVLKPLAFIIVSAYLFFGQQLFFRAALVKAKQNYLENMIQAGHLYAEALHKRVVKVINGKLSPLGLDSNIEGTAEIEDDFNKLRSMRIWIFDMRTLMKCLGTVGAGLSPVIGKLIKEIIKL